MPTTKSVRSADGTKGRVYRQEEVTTRIGDAGMSYWSAPQPANPPLRRG